MNLTPSNDHINRCLTQAMGALHQLNDMGETVLAVTINGPHPVLQIEPPTSGLFPLGALRYRCLERGGTTRRRYYVARLRGCEVRWQVGEQVDRQAVSA